MNEMMRRVRTGAAALAIFLAALALSAGAFAAGGV